MAPIIRRAHRSPGGGVGVIALLLLAGCVAPRTTILSRGSYLGIAGDISVNDQRDKAAAASTADELGLSADLVFMPRIELARKRWHASAEVFRTAYSGVGRASGDLSFGSSGISPLVPLETEASFDYLIATCLRDVYTRGNLKIAAGVGAGMAAYDLYFKQATPPFHEIALDDRLPFGYLTVTASHDFGFLEVLVAASGLAYSSKTSDIDYLEFEGRGNLPIFRSGKSGVGGAVFGFRYHRLEFVWTPPEGTLDLDLDLYGPYVGFGYVF